ncbi:MAG TPA: hypothetical protein VLA02_12415 [Reyranella sp.]|nr:hypothetical protein [Reyranella sp.]
MSTRIDKTWVVLESIENGEHDRCIDLFRRADGSFGFEAFRRDVEDGGLWTAVAYHSRAAYASQEAALAAAVGAVTWLAEALAARTGARGRY